MINLLHKNKRLLVTGRTGGGKSSFIQYHLENEATEDVIFICDVKDEWCYRLGIEKTVEFENIKPTSKIVCFNPLDFPDYNAAFDDYCLFIQAFAEVSNKVILAVFEELQTFVTSYVMPRSFLDILVRGRKSKINMLMASTQPNLIHNSIRASLSEIVVFGQSDDNAIKHSYSLGVNGVEELPDLRFYRKKVGGKPALHEIRFSKKGVDIIRISD